MARESEGTAVGPTALVAVEQYFPQKERVVDDTLAYRMLPAKTRAFVRLLKPRWVRDLIISLSEKSQPGIWGGLLCRKRYIDEKLSSSSDNIGAVVNLGAGFDTREFRLPSLSKMSFWEIDQAKNISLKRQRLRRALGKMPPNVNFVPIDFDREDIGSVLVSHGYSTSERTFFIMEAVTQYLTEEGMDEVLSFLSKAASGSRLLFSYVRKDFFTAESLFGWGKGYKRFVLGKIWHYAMDPVEVPGLLAKYGWRIIEDKGYDELADGYLKPFRRNLSSTPVERMVFAEKVK